MALQLSSGAATLNVKSFFWRRVMDAANIELDLSNTSEQARLALTRRKYDAFLVDCDDVQNGPAVLRELRQGKVKPELHCLCSSERPYECRAGL